jgi:RNA polymerase sigma-70 factor, ECF subfamily
LELSGSNRYRREVGEAFFQLHGVNVEQNEQAQTGQPWPILRLASREATPVCERPDEELMLDHGDGSEEAFAELLRRHQRGVLNYVFRMVNNRHVAEEITQEVFLALVRNAGRYQPTAKFTTYLYAIASNLVSKEWLRRRRRPKLFSFSACWRQGPEEARAHNPLEQVKDDKACIVSQFKRKEISEAVNDALDALPAHQREAFVLRRFQQLAYNEIAAITGAPVGTIKSRVVRAERALRPLLGEFREYI